LSLFIRYECVVVCGRFLRLLWKREAAIEDRLRCVSPRTAAVLGLTIAACVAVLEIVDAAAAAAHDFVR
jgi:hypothetical protein